jgi:hypothetical protein
MINTKAIYSKLLSDSRLTELISEDNIFSSYPNEVEIFPCVIYVDEEQADEEYSENFPNASRCSVTIHIFSKKLDGYITTSEICVIIAQIMNEDLWNCSQNGEVSDPDPDCEHRVMRFNKSIFYN